MVCSFSMLIFNYLQYFQWPRCFNVFLFEAIKKWNRLVFGLTEWISVWPLVLSFCFLFHITFFYFDTFSVVEFVWFCLFEFVFGFCARFSSHYNWKIEFRCMPSNVNIILVFGISIPMSGSRIGSPIYRNKNCLPLNDIYLLYRDFSFCCFKCLGFLLLLRFFTTSFFTRDVWHGPMARSFG